MGDYEREKQALEEMDRALGENMAGANAATDQAITAEPEPTPYEEFRRLVSELQASARQQQLKTEQSIQQTLQQAATALADAQKVDLITQKIKVMEQALSQQGPRNNPQYFLKMLQQLGAEIQEQLHQADLQVAQSLQQTVAAMAQSQAALFDSQSYVKLGEMLKQCEKILQQWQNPGRTTVH